MHALRSCLPLLLAFSTASMAATEWRGESGANLYWINDIEVLFVGYEPDELKQIEDGTKKYAFQVSRSVIVWNSQSNTGRVIAKHATGVLCYSNEGVLYEKAKGGKTVRYRGQIGSEKPVMESPGISDFVRCRTADGRRGNELEHGILELANAVDGQLHWLSADGKRVALAGYRDSDLRTTLITTGIRFYPFKGAYLLAEQGFEGKPSTVWWLYPNGSTEKIDMPVGPWDRQGRVNSSFAASQAGVLVHLPVPMDWSLYVVQSKRVVELVKGAVVRYSVSPNGCNIAYLHQTLKSTDIDRLSRIPVLRSLNVCAKTTR